jgi:hypothetical protein
MAADAVKQGHLRFSHLDQYSRADTAAVRTPAERGAARNSAASTGDNTAVRSTPAGVAEGYVCVQTQPQESRGWKRRRVVFGGLLLLVVAIACGAAARGWRQGGGVAGRLLGGAVELSTQEDLDAALHAEDVAACADLPNGVARNQCMENRAKSRAAPKYWSDDEVRQVLWKTEKALADLQIRQYKHAKERKEAEDEHKDKFAKFKERMEGALDLIHQIQNEMGLRHSQMVTRLRADIALTQTRLRKYLDDGESQVSDKVQTLHERETALTARLISIMDAEAAKIDAELSARHAEEKAKTAAVTALATSVEQERAREDARLTAALAEVKRRIDALRDREAGHVTTIKTGTAAQDAKRARDTAALDAKVSADSTAAGDALSVALTAGKADIRQRLQAAETAAQAAIAAVESAVTEAAATEEGRVSVEGAAEQRNNTAQAALIQGLGRDLDSLNATAGARLLALEKEAARLDAALAAGVAALDQERVAQRAEVLAHVNAAMSAASAAHAVAEGKSRAEVGALGPAVAKVAAALAAAEKEVEEQQRADLAALTGKLETGTASVRATAVAAQDSAAAKGKAAVDAAAASAAARRSSLQSEAGARGLALAHEMDVWTRGQEANNTGQEAAIRAAKLAATQGTAARRAADAALLSRLNALVSAAAVARTQLLGDQKSDMLAARKALAQAVAGLTESVQNALNVADATWQASIGAGVAGQQGSFRVVSARVASNEERLTDDLDAEEAKHAAVKAATEAALQSMEDEESRRRAAWRAADARNAAESDTLKANLTETRAALAAQRTAVKAEQLQALQATLAAAKDAVLEALAGVAARSHAAVTGAEAAGGAALAEAGAAEAALLRNSSALVERSRGAQEAWDGRQAAGVAAVDSTRGADKAREGEELKAPPPPPY